MKLARKKQIGFIALTLFTLAIPIRPFALFLIEDLGIPFSIVALATASALVFITLTICQAAIKKLRWQYLHSRSFAIGFLCISIPMIILMASAYAGWEIGETILLQYAGVLYSFGYFFINPLVELVVKIVYPGWGGWSIFSLGLFIMTLVIMPIIIGTLASVFHTLTKKS